MILVDTLRDFCLDQGFDKTYWVAFSGGLDSQVLLHLCLGLGTNYPIKLRAIHIHHGLSPHADQWALQYKTVCENAGIPYHEHKISLDANTESLEENARKKRYAIFAQVLAKDDMLLTAHHEDDQAETVLLQLMRGSGPKGLAAMPVVKPLGDGFHGRPLLAFSREKLHQYAVENELAWIDDESNQNIKLTRNFIRREVFPILKKRWPTVSKVISRSATHCAEAQSLLEELIAERLDKVQGSKPDTLSVRKLLLLSPALQRLILRTWIQNHEFPLPDADRLQSIQKTVLLAREDASPCVRWQHVEIKRYRDDVFLLAVTDEQSLQEISWDFSAPLNLALGTLHANLTQGRGLRADIKKVKINFRQGGEVVLLGKHHRTLKNLFQEWDVAPWIRSQLPLIYVDDILAAIPHFFIDERFAAEADEMGYELKIASR